jgi:hypothetical protein
MLLETLKMILESMRVPIEDKRIFVEAVCAGPGCEIACRGRAGGRLRFDLAYHCVIYHYHCSTM